MPPHLRIGDSQISSNSAAPWGTRTSQENQKYPLTFDLSPKRSPPSASQAARHGWDMAVEVRKASRFTSSKAWQTQAARYGCQEVDDKEEDCRNCLSGRRTSELGTGQISLNSAAPGGARTSQENQNTRSHLTCPQSASHQAHRSPKRIASSPARLGHGCRGT
jgi:hypothetical protein